MRNTTTSNDDEELYFEPRNFEIEKSKTKYKMDIVTNNVENDDKELYFKPSNLEQENVILKTEPVIAFEMDKDATDDVGINTQSYSSDSSPCDMEWDNPILTILRNTIEEKESLRNQLQQLKKENESFKRIIANAYNELDQLPHTLTPGLVMVVRWTNVQTCIQKHFGDIVLSKKE
jgi:hypothetical protein